MAIHPDATSRRQLDSALDTLLEQLIQERIAPLDGVAVQQAALLAAQRQALARPLELRHAQAFRGSAIGLIDPFVF